MNEQLRMFSTRYAKPLWNLLSSNTQSVMLQISLSSMVELMVKHVHVEPLKSARCRETGSS